MISGISNTAFKVAIIVISTLVLTAPIAGASGDGLLENLWNHMVNTGEGKDLTGMSVGDDEAQEAYGDLNLPGVVMAENFDKGGKEIAYYDSGDGNNGGEYRDTDVDIQAASDNKGEYNIGWIRDGEWLEYTVDVTESGKYDISTRVATNKRDAGEIRVKVDGEPRGTVDVPGDTGGWQSYVTESLNNVELSEGKHVIRLEFIEGDFNLNWMEFEYLGTIDKTESSTEKSYGKVEDWEGGSFDAWNNVDDDWSIVSDPVSNGEYAAGLINSGFKVIYSNSGLPRYPEQGDRFEKMIYLDGNRAELRTLFGYQDSDSSADNTYEVEVSPDDSHLELVKKSDGSRTVLDETELNPPEEEWLKLEVDWGNPDQNEPIIAVLKDRNGNELGVVSAVDGEYEDGGIGFYSRSNPHYFDEWQVVEETKGDKEKDMTPPETQITHSPEYPKSEEVTYTANADEDSSAVSSIEIYVDGDKKKTCTGSSSCSYTEGPYRCNTDHSYYAVSKNTEDMTETTEESRFTAECENQKQSAYGSLRQIPGGIEAENYDSGEEGAAYYDKTSENSGGAYRSDSVDMREASTNYYAITSIESGEWLEYTVNVTESSRYDIKAGVLSDGSGGEAKVIMDRKLLGTLTIPENSGGEASWENVSLNKVNLNEGVHQLRLKIEEGGFDLNWIKICDCEAEEYNKPKLSVDEKSSDSATISLEDLISGTSYVVEVTSENSTKDSIVVETE